MILKFAYRYGVAEATAFDTLDEAVESAWHASEYGTESLTCIEIIGEEGARVIDADEVLYVLAKPLDEAETTAYKAQPKSQAEVWIRLPDGAKASYDSFVNPAQADAVVAELRPILGDRVWVEPLKEGMRLMQWQREQAG